MYAGQPHRDATKLWSQGISTFRVCPECFVFLFVHLTLLPLVWFSITIDKKLLMRPSAESLQAHSTFIRKLQLTLEDCPKIERCFTNPSLTDLTISQIQEPTLASIALIHQHQKTLTNLALYQSTTIDLLEAVVHCKNRIER